MQFTTASVKKIVSGYNARLIELEKETNDGLDTTAEVTNLSERIRSLVLTAVIPKNSPLNDEARLCADMLNRLSRLRHKGR